MGLSWLSQRDLVLVLVLVIMVTSSAIELTGDNVCHQMENYTISLKESYMEPVIVNTFAWCLQIPPRCPKGRVEMRERWRIRTETRQRKVMDCCEGYVVKKNEEKVGIIENSDVGKCVPYCESCGGSSICIAPHVCICGPDCGEECPSGRWGKNCTRACNCQPFEICNPADGKCHCPPGWQGSGCKEKCLPGLWGLDCRFSCACNSENYENNDRLPLAARELKPVCHHETGNCNNFQQIIVPSVFETMMSNRSDREEEVEPTAWSSTAAFVPSSTKKSFTIDRNEMLSTDYDISYANGDSVGETDDDHQDDRVVGESREFAARSPMPIDSEINYDQPVGSFTSTERSLSGETSSDPFVPEISKIETSSIATRIGTNKYDNYNVQQRVERIDMKVPRVKKPSTPGPIVAVVHVSGNGSPDHDGPMIMTSLGAEKIPTHAVPMPVDIAALIVIGSVISLGLTTLAVIAILHIRSKLFETIRLSIYDAEKRDTSNDTIRRGVVEKGNSGRILSTGSNNGILTCEYETPRCMIPEHQTLTRSRPASSVELTKKPETNYSNEYPDIRLFSNLQELLEAHYDRPPSTFRQTVLDVDGEHVYDEIPLQSSTTFATTKMDT